LIVVSWESEGVIGEPYIGSCREIEREGLGHTDKVGKNNVQSEDLFELAHGKNRGWNLSLVEHVGKKKKTLAALAARGKAGTKSKIEDNSEGWDETPQEYLHAYASPIRLHSLFVDQI